jgi:hypothetical protein
MARIQKDEIEKATKLASRKDGVTREDLAKALKIDPRRAAIVLTHTPTYSTRLGGRGKASRTLTFFANA